MGKGGGSAPAPSSQTVNQTNLPAWAQPYSENILGKAEALTDTNKNPYTPYTGQRVADFTPMQQQAFQGIQGMQPNAATGAGVDVAANVAQQAGQYGNYQPQQFGNQYQGQNFNNMGLGYLATQNPNLQSFQMQGPQNVAAERVGTQNFNDPATAQSYMNPYTQNVVNIQQREAQRQADIAGTTANAQASRAGAFGGSRQAIQNAEAARNLATQKSDIQAQGLNSAYNQAQQAFQTDQTRQLQAQQANQQTGLQAGLANQGMGYNVGNTNLQSRLGVQQLGSGQNMQSQLANQGAYGQMQSLGMQQNLANNAQNMQNAQLRAQYGLAGQQGSEQSRQFGSNLGLQGLQQQLAAAGQLGQLGQNQYGQQMGIASAQQQAGAQQQAMNQQNLTNTYQDYLTKANYPYQQLGFMSDILHGTPTGGVTTQQSYQANPSMANQIMGYGLGAYGLSNLLKKEGGVIKGYKAGGVVKHFAEGGITGLPGAMPLEAQYQLALKMGVGPLQGILNGKPSQITPVVAASALKQLQNAQVAANGMQAQQELAKNPGTVLDRMKTQQQPSPLPEDQGGIAALKADNMNDVVQAAEGGIIGYADGGDVKHFQNMGQVPGTQTDMFNGRTPTDFNSRKEMLERLAKYRALTGAAPEAAASITPPVSAAAPSLLSRMGSLAGRAAPYIGGLTYSSEAGAASDYKTGRLPTQEELSQLVQSGQIDDQQARVIARRIQGSAAAPTPDQMQTNQGPYDVGLPTATAPAAPALRTNAPRTAAAPQGLELLNANPDALARMQANIDASKAAAPASLPQGIAAVAPEEAGPPAPKQGSGLGYLDAMNARRTVGFDSIAEAVKQLGMPKSMSDSDKGAAMIEAASSFLTSRTFAEGAGGAGKIIAAKVTALNKTNDEAKRAMLQSQISMETAKMSMDQGDMKHAVDLYNHADTMAFNERKLKIDQNQWSDKKELEYEKLKIERAAERTRALVGEAQAKNLDAEAGLAGAKGNLYGAQSEYYRGRKSGQNAITPAQQASIELKATAAAAKAFGDSRFVNDYQKKYPGFDIPTLRNMYAKELMPRFLQEHTAAPQDSNPLIAQRPRDADIGHNLFP